MFEENENFYSVNPGNNHPQFSVLKKHIERAVQDLFLDALKSRSDELLYVFTEEEQIDLFINRILKYWESFEDYEICQEVVKLSGEFKNKWRNKDEKETSVGIERIKNLFNEKR